MCKSAVKLNSDHISLLHKCEVVTCYKVVDVVNLMVLTSSLAALFHAVLVNVQREQHVGVASLFLICTGSAGAACGDGRIQEECGFLSCWGT